MCRQTAGQFRQLDYLELRSNESKAHFQLRPTCLGDSFRFIGSNTVAIPQYGFDLGEYLQNVRSNNKTVVICSNMPESVNKNLLAAFRYLLKPLVRMALKHGVLFHEFSESLKAAYVDVGAKQVSSSEIDAIEEGISLITNVARADVREILKGGSDSPFGRTAQRVSPMAIILSAWHTDRKYSGPYGVLRDLQFASTGTRDDDSFSALARIHAPGFSPRVLLDELLSVGAVEDLGSGFFRAVKRSYVPDPLSVPSLLNLARVVHNICETLEVNLRAVAERGEGLIERTIFSVHGIRRNQHAEFNKYIRLRGQAFADDIDNWITARDEEGIKDGMQIGVGFYHYIVNDDDEVGLSKDLRT